MWASASTCRCSTKPRAPAGRGHDHAAVAGAELGRATALSRSPTAELQGAKRAAAPGRRAAERRVLSAEVAGRRDCDHRLAYHALGRLGRVGTVGRLLWPHPLAEAVEVEDGSGGR